MIFPFLNGFQSFRQIPITLLLIYLNLFIFLLTFDARPWKESAAFNDTAILEMTGRLYYQFQNPVEKIKPDVMPKRLEDWLIWGGKALRDPKFVDQGDKKQDYVGDQIAIANWKKDLKGFRESYHKRAANVFGLNYQFQRWLTWITYQFMHAGFLHLLMNMIFLFIFGGAVERVLQPFAYLGLYLFSGFAGALAFSLMSHPGLAPVIGASGALSGIMTFYLVQERRKNVAFWYFLSPLPDYHGIIYLPTLVLWPLSVLPDIVGFLSVHTDLGSGVAYAAHLGGAAFGIAMGLLFRWARSVAITHSAQSHVGASSR